MTQLSTIKDVKEWITDWKYPYWRLFGGTMDSKTMTTLQANMDNSDMATSIKRLEEALSRFSIEVGGTFNILLNEDGNSKNNSGPRANVVLSPESATPQYRVAGIGATPDDIEKRINAAVDAQVKILKQEHKHEIAMAAIKREIEDFRDERQSEWTVSKVSGIVDAALANPVMQMIVAKAFGLNGLPPMPPPAVGNPQSDNDLSHDEEKINKAIDILDESGVGNSADILLKVARYAQNNPDQAKMFLNQI
jgi:hypothetical protein